MLSVTFSNRYEALEAALLDALAAPPASPFDAVEVIVPSLAVRRRVELAIADRFGICANVRFSFLGQWLWRQIGHVVTVPEMSPFETPVLAWRVLTILHDATFVAAHPPLARYLHDADDVMRYELAVRTAGLLEQYLTYRPDWLATWLADGSVELDGAPESRREDQRWQAALWHRIARDLGAGGRHPSLAFFDAMRAMGPDAPARAGLPATAHLFCLPATPPLYLDILRRLASWIELTLYVPNPCREYWFDIVDRRRLSYLAARNKSAYRDVGNRLLAAWGRQTQAHVDLLVDNDGIAVIDDAAFAPTAGETLLARIQNAILDLTELDRGSVALAPDDRSIEVHVCHSLTRELEVLQDQLLARFAGPDPPRPSDILVVTPDLDAAAPLIDAVFGNAPDKRRIPYAITSRAESGRNRVAQALLALLAVATSRFAASAVFELLQQPIVARRFGVGEEDLANIHRWIDASATRWGIDGRHRQALGLPAFERSSFSDGLDRLFLGYALPAAISTPLCGRLAAGNAEGSDALALGSFDAFVRDLTRLHAELMQPKSPPGWRQTLLRALDTFTAPMDDELEDARALAASIHQLHADMTASAIATPLPVDIVRAALLRQLDDPTRGGVPGGAVTFAAMASLRHLPYRIVCALGMNDGAFPGAPRPIEFDLMALAPRRGDRERRTDDRNVFLDLLLAARERLYVSYTGRSVRDNSPLPPSVLVAELLDYAGAAIAKPPVSAEALRDARDRLVVQHPLQPFSIDYFKVPAAGDPRLRSFNDEYCAALAAKAASPALPGVDSDGAPAAVLDDADEDDDAKAWEPQLSLFAPPLEPPGPELREITLDALARFFRNPCEQLLRTRLGIYLPESDAELLADDETFVPDVPARGRLAARLLPALLAGSAIADLREVALASGDYPAGRLGAIELDLELARLAAFAKELKTPLDEPTLGPVSGSVEFDLDGDIWRLAGAFGDLRAHGRARYRYDDVRPIDYLNGWVEHLFLNALASTGFVAQTTWHSRDGRYVLPPVPDARAHLAELLRLYRDGLQRPLQFFPRSAWAYMNGSLSAAVSCWYSIRERPFGEDRNPAYRLALRGIADPLDEAFVASAEAVFRPLVGAIVDARVKAAT